MKIFISLIFSFLLLINNSYAIPPPDFFIAMFNAFLQFLGILFAIFVGWFFSFMKFFGNHKKKIIILSSSILVFFLLAGGSYFYFNYKAQQNELKWKENIRDEISNSMSETIILNNNSNLTNVQKFWQKHTIISNLEVEDIIFNDSYIWDRGIDSDKFLDLKKNSRMIIIDLRDRISFRRGSIDGAIHMKLADFVDGGWKELNLEDYDSIFLICYAGTSGYLSADFLYNNGFENVYFFEEGIFQVRDEGKINEVGYNGEFGLKTPQNYHRFLTIDEFESALDNDVVLLDVRPYIKYINDSLGKDSIYFFYEAMPTKDVEKIFSIFDKGTKFVTYCDSGLTCWLTGVVGLELEDRGYVYVGKFTKNTDIIREYKDFGMISKDNYDEVMISFQK